MASQQRRAGIIYLKIDGQQYDAKGSFSYNLGQPKREAVMGSDGVHGYKEVPQVPFIEGELTDSSALSLKSLVTMDGVTVTLELANGKVIAGSQMWYAADGKAQTEEANVEVRFESTIPLTEVL